MKDRKRSSVTLRDNSCHKSCQHPMVVSVFQALSNASLVPRRTRQTVGGHVPSEQSGTDSTLFNIYVGLLATANTPSKKKEKEKNYDSCGSSVAEVTDDSMIRLTSSLSSLLAFDASDRLMYKG